MWPKALTQLVELAPHITRLLPLADRYFKDKSSDEAATRQAIDDLQTNHRAALDAQRASVIDLADRLHADLGAITSQQTTQSTLLARQIADLEKHLTSTRTDALAAKQATESLEARLHRIEDAGKRTQTLAVVAVALLLAILVLIATIFLRAH